MLRVLLAAMVPCFAIGLTGLLVTSIGRVLLATPTDRVLGELGLTPIVALGITILIMVVCGVLDSVLPRRRRGVGTTSATTTVHH
jgi:hypothetical protein